MGCGGGGLVGTRRVVAIRPSGVNDNGRMKSPLSLYSPFTPRTAPGPSAVEAGGRWAPGVSAVLVWLAVGASVAYGVMHGLGRGAAAPVPVAAPAALEVDSQAVARALGARATAPAAAPAAVDVAGRYRLLGVVAPDKASGSGVALLAVQDQRPLPFRVGAVVDGQWVVQSVGKRSVQLAPRQAGAGGTLTLSLPDTR